MAMSITEIIGKARTELSTLTGLDLSSTLGAEKEDGGWLVMVEMVEKRSLPDQMDILAKYEAHMDGEGNFLGFVRKGMRRRMDVVESYEE